MGKTQKEGRGGGIEVTCFKKKKKKKRRSLNPKDSNTFFERNNEW